MKAAPGRDDHVAIIGMNGRFPGASDLEQFWENLSRGVESIRFFTRDELLAAGNPLEEVDAPNYVAARGVMDGAAQFDAGFFEMAPREAELTDPQHRIFLECAWELLEHAGYGAGDEDETIGVYASADFNTYLVHNLLPHMQAIGGGTGAFQAVIASDKDYLASRVSYKLNLKGPSITIQTACSASLVAVHMACQALLNGECDLAIAGGASIASPLIGGYLYQEGIVSPDGHCRAFEEHAGGTVGGSGAGVVLLRRLEDAREAGDTIRAVIRGSAVNNDGSNKVGFTAPSVGGQAKAIAEAMAVAGVTADTISYIEAHGTGTQLGDPIEIEALTRAFGAVGCRQYCAVGSLKTNIGHLNAAAGVAGLIKTALALERRTIPPTVHFHSPNPRIAFASSPFYVNRELAPWPAAQSPRRAGVSSFGIGGTNVHVVLEESGDRPEAVASRWEWHVLPVSGKSEAAVTELSNRLADHLENNPELEIADVAFTLQVGRRAHSHRLAVACRSAAEAAASLRTAGRPVESAAAHAALVFPGEAPELLALGRDLLAQGDSFRGMLDERCRELSRLIQADVSVAAILNNPAFARPALVAVQCSVGMLLRQWGVRAEALAGWGDGELASACLAGVFTPGDALRLVMGKPPGFPLRLPSVRLLSRTGDWIANQATDPSYWNGRFETLLTADRVRSILDSAGLECQIQVDGNGSFGVLAAELARLWTKGARLRLSKMYAGERRRRVDLPIHKLEKRRYWLDSPRASDARPGLRSFASAAPSPLLATAGLTDAQSKHLQALITRYCARTKESKRLAARYRRVHDDNRTVLPYRARWKELCYPLSASRASGSRFWDVDGNEYVDLTMGFGVNLLGHSPAFLNAALERQIQAGIAFGPQSLLAGEVAERISAITGVERAAFCNSGTEAVMLAVRLARAVTGRRKLAIFAGSYHGSFDGVLAKAGTVEGRSVSVPVSPGVAPRMIEDVMVLEYDSSGALDRIREQAGSLAAVLVEPVQSRRPSLAPREFLGKLRECTAAAGIALIFDEMITGFRIHPGGAQAWFEVRADLVTYGKIVAGGLPIGVVAGSPEFLDAMDRTGGGMGTFSRHPLAMAAARAMLAHLEAAGPELQDRLNRRTARFASDLNDCFRVRAAPFRVDHFGSLFRFTFTEPIPFGELVLPHLIEAGVYVWEGGTCFLSTAHTEEDLSQAASVMDNTIREMSGAGLLFS